MLNIMSGPPFKRKFSASSPIVTKSLQAKISEDVDYTQPEKNKPICLKKYSGFSVCLPPLQAFPEEFKHWYNINILDLDMKDDLQREKVINWCRTAKPLYPIKTTADGNCLMHAISLALWGIEDDNQFLRRLVYVALAEDSTQRFQKRWLLQLRQLNQEQPTEFNYQIESNDWRREWESVITAASDLPAAGNGLAYATLESIHVYVIANVLRRPIIILADSRARTVHGQSIQENSMRGIYLPLEWDHSATSKCPLIIGFNLNHFAPLVSQENLPDGRAIDGEYVVPLIMSDHTQLPLKFLLSNEEPVAHELLKQYLKMRTIPMTLTDTIMEVPAARTEHLCIFDADDIVKMHRLECEKIYRRWVQQDVGHTVMANLTSPRSVRTETVPPSSGNIGVPKPLPVPDQQTLQSHQNEQFWPYVKCVSPGCEMFGTPDTANMCSKCFGEYTVRYNRDEMARKGLQEMAINTGPTAPPPSIPPPQSGVYLSMLGELCKNKCGLRCSVKTFPYCHECAPKKCKTELCPNSPTPGCDSYCKQCFDKLDENLFGEGENSHHLTPPNSRSEISSEECTTPNCKGKALRGKCARCIIRSGWIDSLTNSGSQSDPSSETYVMRVPSVPEATGGGQSMGPINTPSPPEAYQYYKCKTKDCKEFAIIFKDGTTDGYCKRCYEAKSASGSQQPVAQTVQNAPVPNVSVPKHFCATPGCEGVRLVQSPYCLRCTRSQNKGLSVLPQEGVNMPGPESTPLESSTPSSAFAIAANPIITSSKQKIKCSSPLCETLVYPPKLLCDRCTEILRFNHALGMPNEASGQEKERSRSLEAIPNCPVKHGQSYSPSRQKCLEPGCTFYGDKRFNNYCSQCFQKGKAKTAPISAKPSPQLSNVRPQTVPAAERPRNCVEPGCDRYGDPNMYYRCTEHYTMARQTFVPAYPPNNQGASVYGNTQQFNVSEQQPVQILQAPAGWQPSPVTHGRSQPIAQPGAPNQDQSYLHAMAKVEGARKNGSMCKTSGCGNFGNSKSEGYCNSCNYRRIQESRQQNPSRDEYQCC